jgi:hypothetical protein
MKIYNNTLAANTTSAEIDSTALLEYSVVCDAQVTILAKNAQDGGFVPVTITPRTQGSFGGVFTAPSDKIKIQTHDSAVDVEVWEETVVGSGSAGSPSESVTSIQGIEGGYSVDTKDQVGVAGGQVIANTTPRTGLEVSAISIISDAVFTTLTGNLSGYAAITFPAGTLIRGSFTQITLASGTIIAYNS